MAAQTILNAAANNATGTYEPDGGDPIFSRGTLYVHNLQGQVSLTPGALETVKIELTAGGLTNEICRFTNQDARPKNIAAVFDTLTATVLNGNAATSVYLVYAEDAP